MLEIPNYRLTNEWSWGAMSGPVPDGSKSVVPFGAKSKKVASSVADPLEAAGQTILGLVHCAASTAEKNYQQALDFTQKLSAQLKAAEDRIKGPGSRRSVSGGQGRSCRKMAYKISVEIEQRFFGGDDSRRVQVPASQAQSQGR
jgi:hypothetical protein